MVKVEGPWWVLRSCYAPLHGEVDPCYGVDFFIEVGLDDVFIVELFDVDSLPSPRQVGLMRRTFLRLLGFGFYLFFRWHVGTEWFFHTMLFALCFRLWVVG
jgi:hypothetical protein